ncbi:MAG: TIGR01777 family oxidoreductase [Sporocytophaga sp.]|nr:TIGR01777 family oxidoreductase [Sporocytophaga sp.]
MKGKVLITGGTGIIGSRLTEILKEKEYEVAHLSRSTGKGDIKTFIWDVKTGAIDDNAIKFADYIVHLAGANVFEHKWTNEVKQEIIDSRVKSADLLIDTLKKLNHPLKAFISASAIGYYGADTGGERIVETSPKGKDFIAKVTEEWEAAVDNASRLGIRTVKLRTGIVFSKEGGALEQLVKTVNRSMGASVGSGKQLISWIHIDDLCNMYIKAIEDESMSGVYNAAGVHPDTNQEVMKEVAGLLGKHLLPNVPSFVLKMMLGSERAELVLGGNNISEEKILNAGFQFKYQELRPTLQELLSQN